MSLLKRLSITMRSQLDEAVSRIENHDAVIDVALRESRDAIARLKVQQSRMRNSAEHLDSQLMQLSEDQQRWVDRAKAAAHSDEAQALACLERRDRCADQATQLQEERERCEEMALRLSHNISKLERKLLTDQQRLQAFRGRDLSVRAENHLHGAMGPEPADLEQAFERWELEITRKEMQHEAAAGMSVETDTLEARFEREERLAARRAELKALMEDAS
jgi:phage shock protein A